MMSILLITNKSDITMDFIVKDLTSKNLPFYRLNTEDIGDTVQVVFDFSNHSFSIVDKLKVAVLDLLKVKSVYFRRPEINDQPGELSHGERNFIRSELLFTLEGLFRVLGNAFWVNTVWAIRNAENKIHQLLLAKQIGFTIPNAVITNIPESAQKFYRENDGSCIIKPIKSGLVEGDDEQSVIFTNELVIDENNFVRIAPCPVYLQKLIKKTGDIRVTVVGNKVFAALIHSQEVAEALIDWRKSALPLKHTIIQLPDEISKKCLSITNALDLNFAAIDLVLDENEKYIFLEVNPNGQWAWIEKQLNFNISDEITNLMVENQTH